MVEKLTKRAINIRGQNYAVDVSDKCPICHRHSEVAVAICDEVDEGQGVQVVFRCGFQGCRAFFICSYGPKPSGEVLAVRPLKPPMNMFSEEISKLSPTICFNL